MLDTVKIEADAVKMNRSYLDMTGLGDTASAGYHHGDLPNVLRASAVEVIRSGGLHGFSLREVARRAGVSHAAPGYHFGDVRGLLTAVAIEGFTTLHDELVAAITGIDDPLDRLSAIGLGYVRVASEYPAHCEVMFRDDVLSEKDVGLVEAGLAAYAVLEETVASIAERYNPDLVVEDAARLCWSAMQGLVTLQSKFNQIDDTTGRANTTLDRYVERFAKLIVAGMVSARAPASGAEPTKRRR